MGWSVLLYMQEINIFLNCDIGSIIVLYHVQHSFLGTWCMFIHIDSFR